ncbi:hypothetical protein FA014_02000 [Cellulomonas hominis]|uniref:Uncharacterized protein n=1 Tax=Cellulomonas hominis TaxID=156981 RepID=A0A7Z8K1R8_9CELL|nr:hypothetical protein [Cellulomonas hominis]TKR27153.1 hypothetical protein FA014_02000 [Cellulomonas hominis]
MTQTPDANAILMGGAGVPAAKFPNPGDMLVGRIVAPPQAYQERDYDKNNPGSGTPKTYPSGDPIMALYVDVATDLRDPSIEDDDGTRRLFVEGRYLKGTIRDAVRAAGAPGLEVGGTLTLTFTHREDPEDKRSRKYWQATYVPGGNAALMTPDPAPAAVTTPAPTPQAVTQPVQAAPAPVPVQQSTLAAAAAAPAPAPAAEAGEKARQLISLGIDDATIADATGLDASVIRRPSGRPRCGLNRSTPRRVRRAARPSRAAGTQVPAPPTTREGPMRLCTLTGSGGRRVARQEPHDRDPQLRHRPLVHPAGPVGHAVGLPLNERAVGDTRRDQAAQDALEAWQVGVELVGADPRLAQGHVAAQALGELKDAQVADLEPKREVEQHPQAVLLVHALVTDGLAQDRTEQPCPFLAGTVEEAVQGREQASRGVPVRSHAPHRFLKRDAGRQFEHTADLVHPTLERRSDRPDDSTPGCEHRCRDRRNPMRGEHRITKNHEPRRPGHLRLRQRSSPLFFAVHVRTVALGATA